jgi:hypothetical protein
MGTRHKVRPSHPHNEGHLRSRMQRPRRPIVRLHALQPRRRTSRAIWTLLCCPLLSIRMRFYVEDSSLIEHPPRLVTACSRDGPCSRTNVRTPSVMGYPSFAHRNQGVVKIPERLVIGSLLLGLQRDYNYYSGVRYLRLGLRRRAKPGQSGSFNNPASCKPTEERADKDKDVETLDLPNPVELKSNVTIPPAAIHPQYVLACSPLVKQLKRVRRTQHPPIYLRRMATRGKHVHQTFISLPPHVRTVHKVCHQHTHSRKHCDTVRFTYLISGYFPLGMLLRESLRR